MNIKIICPPGADGPTAFAARELSAYLGRMLAGEEGELAIGLEVRPDERPGLPDWFSVELDREKVSIIGNSGRAVLLGVYDYLRRQGCRILTPFTR